MTNLTIIGGSYKTPTIAERLQGGAVAVHQGRNYVTLSGDELARLVAVAAGHASSIARSPAKARPMRYPITRSQQTPAGTRPPTLS